MDVPVALLFALFAALAFAPLIIVAIYVSRHGGTLTGVNGGDYYDQFQYLAWMRDAGAHGLASNLWVVGPTPHDYLQPMYLISGALWRIGVSIQVAYLFWKPVAILIVFVGFTAYVWHIIPTGRLARCAALTLALFYVTPFSPVANWLHWLSPTHAYQLLYAVDDATSYLNLWGFDHIAIAIGLAPVFLIASERILAGDLRRGRWTVTASAAGMFAAWLHPWQAVMVLGALAGMFALRGPRRRYVRLAIPVAATVAPLIYTLVLSRTDASWRGFEHGLATVGHAPWWALVASFGPLGVFALLGIRRPQRDRDLMLLLWFVARVVVYFVVPDSPSHALCGITLPLAVLAVGGWQRATAWVASRRPSWTPISARVALASAAVLAVTVPGVVSHLQNTLDSTAHTLSGAISRSMIRLTDNQSAALRFLDHDPRPGGVLAPRFLSLSIPEFTGRDVFVGHAYWEPAGRALQAAAFYSGGPSAGRGSLRRTILRSSGVRFVIDDCGAAPAGLASDIAPVATPVASFGCVVVYHVT